MCQRSPQAVRVFAATALAVVGLAACSSVNHTSHRLVDAITPYKIEVVQGNFVSREQVQALRPGMSREQVRNILGTPLVTSLFHADRWDYVFTIRRAGVNLETKKLTVYFTGYLMDRVEGDEMPTESEFVAAISSTKRTPKVPKLEASPEELERYAPKAGESGKESNSGTASSVQDQNERQPAGSFPPLER